MLGAYLSMDSSDLGNGTHRRESARVKKRAQRCHGGTDNVTHRMAARVHECTSDADTLEARAAAGQRVGIDRINVTGRGRLTYSEMMLSQNGSNVIAGSRQIDRLREQSPSREDLVTKSIRSFHDNPGSL